MAEHGRLSHLKSPRRAARLMRQKLRNVQSEHEEWSRRGYAMPAPQAVKWAVLRRYGIPSSLWIETGTYLGDTTAFLAKGAKHVYSIEPEPQLAARARTRFAKHERITIVEGTSEDRFGELVAGVEQGPVSFWLDGHYSAGMTYQGESDTPIRDELSTIERNLDRLESVAVLVDDVRCFDPDNPHFAGYPSRAWLVDWAERNGLPWTIEHDIFVASK